MSARDALAAIRERAEAATEGPWRARLFHGEWQVVDGDVDVIAETRFDMDPEFIGHARLDVPALVGALESVLEKHQPEWTSDHHGGGYYRCSADHWTLDDQTPSCPTVTAIETALEDR